MSSNDTSLCSPGEVRWKSPDWRGNAPTRRRLNLNFAGRFRDVGLHLQLDVFRRAVRKQDGGLRPLQRYRRLNHNRARQFALRALDVAVSYRTNHFDILGLDPQMKMRLEQRRIFRQTDVELIRDRVRVALLGLDQPVGLRQRLMLGDGGS